MIEIPSVCPCCQHISRHGAELGNGQYRYTCGRCFTRWTEGKAQTTSIPQEDR